MVSRPNGIGIEYRHAERQRVDRDPGREPGQVDQQERHAAAEPGDPVGDPLQRAEVFLHFDVDVARHPRPQQLVGLAGHVAHRRRAGAGRRRAPAGTAAAGPRDPVPAVRCRRGHAVAVRAPRSSNASSPKISPGGARVSTIFCPVVSWMNSSTSPDFTTNSDSPGSPARNSGVPDATSTRSTTSARRAQSASPSCENSSTDLRIPGSQAMGKPRSARAQAAWATLPVGASPCNRPQKERRLGRAGGVCQLPCRYRLPWEVVISL